MALIQELTPHTTARLGPADDIYYQCTRTIFKTKFKQLLLVAVVIIVVIVVVVLKTS